MCVCVSGLTAAAMAELQKLQKMKMMMSLQNGNESDNDDLHSNTGRTPVPRFPNKRQRFNGEKLKVTQRANVSRVPVRASQRGRKSSGYTREYRIPQKKQLICK